MFTVETSNTTVWEEKQWEQMEGEFETFEQAEAVGEQWQERQSPVESFDGFHNAATFSVVEV